MAIKKEDTVKESNPQDTPHTSTKMGWPHGAGFIIAAVVIAVVLFAGVMAAARHSRELTAFDMGSGSAFSNMRERGFGRPGHMFGDSTSTGQDHLRGVVTAVNGTDFTVAGNGATTQVSTSSSTQYVDGNQVKVNDSVIVSGTSSNGTLQANEVVINP